MNEKCQRALLRIQTGGKSRRPARRSRKEPFKFGLTLRQKGYKKEMAQKSADNVAAENWPCRRQLPRADFLPQNFARKALSISALRNKASIFLKTKRQSE
jgi:hypothetical protein